MSQCEEGICVVELRDADGTVIHFEEPEFCETTGKKLHKINDTAKVKMDPFSKSALSQIVATDFAGTVYKGDF